MPIDDDEMPFMRLECLKVAVRVVDSWAETRDHTTLEDLADHLLNYVLNGQKEKAGG